MDRSATISKFLKLDESRNYEQLREEGLKHIERLSSNIWTDYNVHDPGITLLELLCYAITDLGYRTAYDIKDLLADSSAVSPPTDHQFYTAREILTCNPVTIEDFRKLLIDIRGVKNAWLEPGAENSQPLFLNCKRSAIEYSSNDDNSRFKLRGLYTVTLELDEDPKHGDLNHYQYSMLLNPEDERDEEIIVGLPDWSRWMATGLRPDEMESVDIQNIHDINRFDFEAEVVITTADGSVKLPAWIKTTQKGVDPNTLKDQFKEESVYFRYRTKLHKALRIAWCAHDRLHQHRNLCEDYHHFRGIEIEKVSVCSDIRVTNEANIEKILAKIFFALKRHLAPDVKIYSLEEMIDKGRAVDEIFEGPPLDHGFIDSEELERSEIVALCEESTKREKKKIYASDLIRIMMDVDGVKAVDNLVLGSTYRGEILQDKVEWCLEIGANRFPRLNMDEYDIMFYKENIPYKPNRGKVYEYLMQMELGERGSKYSSEEDHDFEIPGGTNRLAANYISIQEHLPLTYGTGSKGIPGVLTKERIAQSKQLKGYLTFYDQLLANYLAQLANVKNLFSFSPDITQTYYYQLLYSLPKGFTFPDDDPGSEQLFSNLESPRIHQLIRDFIETEYPNPVTDIDDFSTLRDRWKSYKKKTGLDDTASTHFVKSLDAITEDRATFEDRRNRFLNHLLARFGESFTDYVLMIYSIADAEGHGETRDADELIHDKEQFLIDYPVISSERGKGYDYRDENNLWDTDNVSGFSKRISRLLGIERYNRRTLTCKPVDELFERFKNEETGEWRFRLLNQEGDIVLRSEGYTRKSNRENGIESVMTHGIDEKYYEKHISSDERFYFNLVAVNGEIIGNSRMYDRERERDRAIASMIADLRGKCNREGFYLVEHILLRPESDADNPLPVCVKKNCNDCPGFKDPYSFRISLIIPYWPDRFDNMAFRRFFEKTARREAPAHVHLKICWADQEDIEKFENVYKPWLKSKAGNTSAADRSEALNNLIDVMNQIRSVYPVATLHDCVEEADENPLLLDNTALGTFKPE